MFLLGIDIAKLNHVASCFDSIDDIFSALISTLLASTLAPAIVKFLLSDFRFSSTLIVEFT